MRIGIATESGLGAAMEVTVLGTSDFTDATRAFDGAGRMTPKR